MEYTEPSYNIAVVGMAGRFPGASNVNQFWENLCLGVESIIQLDDNTLLHSGETPEMLQHPDYVKTKGVLLDGDCFDAQFFGINPREAALMDPQHRVFLECAWHALEDAGYNPGANNGRIGVYAGTNINTYLLRNILSTQENFHDYQVVIANDKDFITTQVSYRLNLNGPGITVQTACSTSLVAVHLACQSLLNWECDMALAGGAAVTVPLASGYLYQDGGVVSPDGHCRAFDAKAQGTVGGNGVGIVVLKRLSDALETGDTVLAVIKGSAVNNDGSRKIGYTAPSEEGQVEVIAEALAVAGVPAESITYVESHGTGTLLGDPIEVAALNRAFRLHTAARHFCALGSVKSNIGHLDAAAGIASLIKTILAIRHKQIPPSLHFTIPNPKIDFEDSPFFVNTQLRDWDMANGEPRRAGVSTFGIGGTNAHLIVEEFPLSEPTLPTHPEHLLLLSAKTAESLEQMTINLANDLRQRSHLNLSDVAYTLQVGRQPFTYRRALVCKTIDEAVQILNKANPGQLFSGTSPSHPPKIVFMFPGQGAQYVNMGRDLYRYIPVFRTALERCATLLHPLLGFNLAGLLYPAAGSEMETTQRLTQTAVTQPALFAIEYALAQMWQSWGITPQALIGHSIGEYVAACLAGVFSLEDALAIVVRRGQLMQQLPPGAMLHVSLAAPAIQPYLNDELSLAAVNGSHLCVVAGPETAVSTLKTHLEQQGISCRLLHTSHAFHSHMMQPIAATFMDYVAQFTRKPPQIPLTSNVTGTWLTAEEAIDPAYWARHLLQTVRFADGIQTIQAEMDAIFLEVGPGRTLQTFVQPNQVINSLRHPQEAKSDTATLWASLAQLWLSGVTIRWEKLYGSRHPQRISLPGYPFARERHWIHPQTSNRTSKKPGKRADIPGWFYVPYWKPAAPPTAVIAPTSWLIVTDEPELEQVLRLRLETNGHTVTVERTGNDYLNVLRATSPKRIIYCASDHFNFTNWLHLTQAIGKGQFPAIHMDVVTHQAQPVNQIDSLNLEQTLILGAISVMAQEYSYATYRCVDVASTTRPITQVYAHLANELQAEPTHPIVAYRGSRRWVQAFDPFLPPVQTHVPLRSKGVYLITGGFGRIGRVVARYLAETYQARLVLTSRAGLPPRAEWQHWLEKADQEAICDRIRFVMELETQGAEALIFKADVADVAQMKAVISQAEQAVGALHGVLHMAAVVGEETAVSLLELTPAVIESQLRPKVQGTRVLAEVLADRSLDFCLLFSSTASLLGGLGFAVYAAANRFMDGFAQNQQDCSATPWLSVNWDGWQFAATPPPALANFRVGKEIEDVVMTPQEGIQAFIKALQLRHCSQLIISPGDWHPRFDEWITNLSTQKVVPKSTTTHHRPSLQNPYIAPRNDIENKLTVIWQELLGVIQIGIYDSFFDLGGHSLLAAQLMSQIRQTFSCDLSVRQLFEAPTIAEMAVTIAGQQLGNNIDETKLETLMEEIENLSDEELDRLLSEEF